uniref:PABS domain-containing protein n=1 Tax=Chromera velia CCMP2878 TaxID=1169474 RepID=A0A0G4GZW4_9ALVE|eukprot:Cvel_5478.t1-p1 / transcript=Cvel_5478.t1 / gene=Cvel_5478 / organism=Chromera_velia_CCMP2878 / gene_product=hypothetical protein / transcript_product=hypothetical protein / location=Cvel_scaffold256:51747-57493(+) / protein_length=417 / sequence_SO=supercontig / SO=protein_coding / is_pseudo=false
MLFLSNRVISLAFFAPVVGFVPLYARENARALECGQDALREKEQPSVVWSAASLFDDEKEDDGEVDVEEETEVDLDDQRWRRLIEPLLKEEKRGTALESVAETLRKRNLEILSREGKKGLGAFNVPEEASSLGFRIFYAAVGGVQDGETGERYKIGVMMEPRRNIRDMVFDNYDKGVQSRVVCKGPPCQKCFEWRFANGLRTDDSIMNGEPEFILSAGRSPLFRVLLLGLGGAGIPPHILERLHAPLALKEDTVAERIRKGGGGKGYRGRGVELVCVDYDPMVGSIAKRFFGFSEEPGCSLRIGGAAEEVEELIAKGEKFHAVVVDCFQNSVNVPSSVRSASFLRNMRTLLVEGGKVLHNIWGWIPEYSNKEAFSWGVTEEFVRTIIRYEEVFGKESVTVDRVGPLCAAKNEKCERE